MSNAEERTVYTVSELTRDIKFALEDTFPKVWVEGEASNLKVAPSGHTYFSLKDDQAVINCVLFKRSGAGGAAPALEDGMHLLCSGRISVYAQRGAYQLYVETAEPKGQGALAAAFESLKKKLHKEGIFDEAHKKPLPFMPMRVGVVTSPTGAVIRDIIKVAKRRFGNIEITLRPVKVQGAGAKEDIAAAIAEFNEYNRRIASEHPGEHPIDVMIVGRGGGSMEELWPFNEEIVARAIYGSEIPVVSAVGHEVDYTISDFAADLRAPTPSAAAELVVPLKQDVDARIKELEGRLYLAAKGRVTDLEEAVAALSGSYIMRSPVNVFLQLGERVDDLGRAAATGITHVLEIKRGKLAAATGKLGALNPLAVLERGYSVTFAADKVVKSAGQLKVGETVMTRLAKGRFTSKVEGAEA